MEAVTLMLGSQVNVFYFLVLFFLLMTKWRLVQTKSIRKCMSKCRPFAVVIRRCAFFPLLTQCLLAIMSRQEVTYILLCYLSHFEFLEAFFILCESVCFPSSLPPNQLPTCPFTNGHCLLLKLIFLRLYTPFF